MAPRARLTAEDRRRQIMGAAGGLFARRGFSGTTTRQIAERAHINEALIFRHFPNKEDLYWAVLQDKCRPTARRKALHERLASSNGNGHSANTVELFGAIAEDLLRRNSEDTTRTRLLLFSALDNHRLAHRFFRTYMQDYYGLLAAHIRERIRRGEFRHVNPLLAARGFLGMLVYHIWIQELFGGHRYEKLDPRQVSRTLTEIWMEGMRPRS
jgi:AcrR family transcriptional regulator